MMTCIDRNVSTEKQAGMGKSTKFALFVKNLPCSMTHPNQFRNDPTRTGSEDHEFSGAALALLSVRIINNKKTTGEASNKPAYQSGFALPTAMIFLTILTILGISAMNGTRVDQAQMNKMNEMNQAFHYAESGIAAGLESQDLMQIIPSAEKVLCVDGCSINSSPGNAIFRNRYIGPGNKPPVNYSLDSGLVTHYFEIVSEGTSVNSTSSHLQGLTMVGPGDQG